MVLVLPVPVHACRQLPELGAVVPAGLVDDERVGFEHGGEPLAGSADPVADAGEVLQVGVDLALVPGDQDRLDVREVLVQRGAPDAGCLGDLRHRDCARPVLAHQRHRGVQNRFPHLAAVRRDRLAPQLRHDASIQRVNSQPLCIDNDALY